MSENDQTTGMGSPTEARCPKCGSAKIEVASTLPGWRCECGFESSRVSDFAADSPPKVAPTIVDEARAFLAFAPRLPEVVKCVGDLANESDRLRKALQAIHELCLHEPDAVSAATESAVLADEALNG